MSDLASVYLRFAALEAAHVSETFFDWATGVAGDPEVLALIAGLPGIKRQPNLIFAAARFAGAPVGRYGAFREWLVAHWNVVLPVIMTRATQTNEAARCAVLLPVLAQLRGDLALIEAGASAGLVLYPDRYSYRYDAAGEITVLDPVDGPSTVQLPCLIDAASVPTRLPEVVWRAGVDLRPIDVRDGDQLRWLEALIWPEHDARRERLHAAASILAANPPHVVEGDILEKIPELVAEAPRGAHVVVFHSAVLVYLAPERRSEFVEVMGSLSNVTWISNEGEAVLPSIAAKVNVDVESRTILAVNGDPVALVGPHGQSFQRLSPVSRANRYKTARHG